MSEYSKPFLLPSSRSICEDPMIPGRRWQKKSRTGKIGSWSASSSAPFRHLDCRTVGGSSLRTDCTVALRKALSSYTVINDDCGNCLKRTTNFPTRNVFSPWTQCIVYTAVSRLVVMFSALCANSFYCMYQLTQHIQQSWKLSKMVRWFFVRCLKANWILSLKRRAAPASTCSIPKIRHTLSRNHINLAERGENTDSSPSIHVHIHVQAFRQKPNGSSSFPNPE